MAAESDLKDLVARLRVALPVPARGVAMATSLLRDGAGPLYNLDCGISLRALVRRAVAELDPSVELDRSA